MEGIKTYLIPRYGFDDHYQMWEAFIEERTADKNDDTVFAWHEGYFHTAHQALEAVTNEWVRMCSNTIRYENDG